MSTLKGRNAHKGRTFGGVAACPHCSHPIRAYITAARTQCLLDLVSVGYLVPPYVPLVDVSELPDAPFLGYDGAANASAATTTATDAVSVPMEHPASAGAERSVAYSDERGFDDDEAPFPTQGELGLR